MSIEVVLLRLALTSLLGLIIGLERELKRKPLGLKTCIVISVSSCLLTIVSIQASVEYANMSINIRTDPMRLAAQIVSGIGFLGAGVILRRGFSVSGLTTAAIIWAAAGIGISVGAGFYYESIAGVLIILFAVKIVPFVVERIGPKKLRAQELKVSVSIDEVSKIKDVMDKLRKHSIDVEKLRIKDLPSEVYQIDLNVVALEMTDATDIYLLLHTIPGVVGVEIET